MKELMGGQLEFLAKKEVYDIYVSALDVLENVGIRIDETNALRIFDDSGAVVDHKRQHVWLPAGLVEEAIRKAPSRFTWFARNPSNNARMDNGRVHFSPGGTFAVMVDLETGERRPTTLKDTEDFARLINALEYVHEGSALITPTDLPRQDYTSALHMYAATLKNTEKCVRGAMVQTGGIKSAQAYIRMASVLAGGVEELRKAHYLMSCINPVSPLQYSKEALEAVIEYAKHNIPMFFSPEVQAGATGPVTLAGTLVQTIAEALGGITLAEIVNPGNPIMLGTVSTVMDMRTGQISLGAIETGILDVCTAQVARYLGIPCRVSAGATEAKMPDAQAGYEVALDVLLASLAGANLIQYAAGSLEFTKTASYEMMVIGNEILGMVSRALQGVNVTEETLAVDLIGRVGVRGHYLGQKHTREYYEREHHIPILSDRQPFDTWRNAGAKTAKQKANEIAKKILKESRPEPLDKDVEKELGKILKEVEKGDTWVGRA